MNTPELEQATEALLAAIRGTDAYRRYAELKENVMADEGSRALLRRFTSAQTALQVAAIAGAEAKPEDAAAFEQLSALLYANPEAADFLLAQMKVQQLAANVMDQITKEVGIDVPLPEL
ncbi:MAG: YlbF family regulator [Eubacteriales bacterium]|nr:YlbF family regulator [Eubacteriales bacterium]